MHKHLALVQLKAAVISVLRDKKSYQAAADLHGVSKTTLRRWATQTTAEQAESGIAVETLQAGHKTVRIFNIFNNYFEKKNGWKSFIFLVSFFFVGFQ